MKKTRIGFRIPSNYVELTAPLGDLQKGILITTLCEYAFEDKITIDENLTKSDLEIFEKVFMAIDFDVYDDDDL